MKGKGNKSVQWLAFLNEHGYRRTRQGSMADRSWLGWGIAWNGPGPHSFDMEDGFDNAMMESAWAEWHGGRWPKMPWLD